MAGETAYCWRIHSAQLVVPKLYVHMRRVQGHRSIRVTSEGKVIYRTLEVPANWEKCVGADGHPLDDVKAYAIFGPARDIVDGVVFRASPIVEVLGLSRQDDSGVDLVVKVFGNVNAQCVVNSSMLINAMEGLTVRAVTRVQEMWRGRRPLWEQLKAIHVAIRPELARLRFDLSHYLYNTAEGVYARQLKRAIVNGCPLGAIPEYMDQFINTCISACGSEPVSVR